MKIIFRLSLLVLIQICIISCSGSKEPSSQSSLTAHEAFASSLTSQDTAVIKQLCEDFLNSMKSNETDIAFSILRRIDESGKVVEPSSEQLAKLSTQFKLFPVKKYVLKDLKIGSESDNICSYSIIFDIDESGKESAINFGFCPVKIGKDWYITVRNNSSELPQ